MPHFLEWEAFKLSVNTAHRAAAVIDLCSDSNAAGMSKNDSGITLLHWRTKEYTQRKQSQTHSKDLKSPLFPAIPSSVFAVSKTLLACIVYLRFTANSSWTSCLGSSKPEPRMFFFCFISFLHIAHSEDNENVHSSHLLPSPRKRLLKSELLSQERCLPTHT